MFHWTTLTIMLNTADIDNFPSSARWEEMKDMFRKVNERDPHYDPRILNVLVDLSEHGKEVKS